MGYGLLSRVIRVRVTAAYAVTLTVVSTTLLALGPEVQGRVIRHASTNLHNLSHGRLGTLICSAFVIDAGPVYLWLPGLLCLLGLGELLWRSSRLMVAFAVGHVGATLLVAIGLTAAVELAWLPPTVTRASDVGMSYGAVAVLGALTAAISRRWRPPWIGWWLAVSAAVVVGDQDFTDVGHLVALALGMAVATRFGRPQPWTPTRLALLAGSASFGYLILVSAEVPMASPTAAGAFGALLGLGWASRSSWRRTPEAAVGA